MSVFTTRTKPATRTTRLSLEALEDRTVPAVVDLTTLNASGAVDNVVFMQAAPDANVPSDEILRLSSGKKIEQGYNSDGAPQFDEKPGRTRTVRMLDLVPVTANGITYRVLELNINEARRNPLLSLDELRLYVSNSDSTYGYNKTTKKLGGISPVFDLGNNFVKLDTRVNDDASKGDMLVYIPQNILTAGGDSNPYVYLYSKFGVNFANTGGKEKWGPAVGVVPPPPGPPSTDGTLAGVVFWDANGNGINDDTNAGIPGVDLMLTGTADDGTIVELLVTTDADGAYKFEGLKPGTYDITETQPFGYISGVNTVGTIDGVENGTLNPDVTDVIFSVHLPAGKNGINYNFGETVDGGVS